MDPPDDHRTRPKLDVVVNCWTGSAIYGATNSYTMTQGHVFAYHTSVINHEALTVIKLEPRTNLCLWTQFDTH